MGILVASRGLESLKYWANQKDIERVVLSDNCCEELIEWAIKNIKDVLFIDIDEATKGMDVKQLQDVVKGNKLGTKLLVLWVWPYGSQPSTESLIRVANSGECTLLEDKCLARPLLPQEDNLNEHISNAQLYSTGYSKYCDLLHGGWLFDSNCSDRLLDDILLDDYFRSVEIRRTKVDIHKKYTNNKLDRITDQIRINDWKATTWRYCFEIQKPKLFSTIIKKYNGFSSNHYDGNKYSSQFYLPITRKHKKHVFNLFNDLRANQNYIDIIEKASEEYLNVLHNTL